MRLSGDYKQAAFNKSASNEVLHALILESACEHSGKYFWESAMLAMVGFVIWTQVTKPII